MKKKRNPYKPPPPLYGRLIYKGETVYESTWANCQAMKRTYLEDPNVRKSDLVIAHLKK